MLKKPNPEIPIGFLIATVFWIPIFLWQASYSLTERQKQQCYDEAKNSGHKNEECKTLWERTTSDPVAFFTFTLTVVTLALGVISVRQFHYLKRSDATARIAAEAARDSADAFPIVERAYVYPIIVSAGTTEDCIENAKAFYLGDPTKDDEPTTDRAEITFKLKNYGKTPAILKRAYAGLGVYPVGAELGLSIPESILGEMETTSELFCRMQFGLTRNQVAHIMVYTGSLSFSGEVTFDDIWGNELTTRFYFSWDKEIRRFALRDVETETGPKNS